MIGHEKRGDPESKQTVVVELKHKPLYTAEERTEGKINACAKAGRRGLTLWQSECEIAHSCLLPIAPAPGFADGSEGDAAGEFKAARAGSLGGFQSGDGAETEGVHLHIGRLVVAMVEEVGRFKAELQPRLF